MGLQLWEAEHDVGLHRGAREKVLVMPVPMMVVHDPAVVVSSVIAARAPVPDELARVSKVERDGTPRIAREPVPGYDRALLVHPLLVS